jgi:cyclic-di-AMP phosphodiesterase PgpH
MRLSVASVLARSLGAWLGARAEAWSRRSGAVILVGTGLTACVLGVLIASPRMLRPSYQYALGDFSTAPIRAPWDLSIRDDDATARLRDETARHTPPVASFDVRPTTDQPARITEAFADARKQIAAADATREVPAADVARLGAPARRRLQQARARDADRAVQVATQDALAQVEIQFGMLLTPDERTLIGAGRFDRRFDDGLLALLKEAYARPIARDARTIREAAMRSQRPGEPPRVVLREVTGAERVLPDAAMLDDVPGAIARLHARAPYLLPASSLSERTLLVGLASRLVSPDTAYDEAATSARRAKAAADVLPISLNFRRNQLIVGEGREVTREALLVLDYLRRQGMPQAFLGRAAGAAALTWLLCTALLWLPHRLGLPGVSLRDAGFVLTSVIGATAGFWLWLMIADGVSARSPGLSRAALLLMFPATAAPMLAGLVGPRRVVVGLVGSVAVTAGLLTDLGIVMTAHIFAVGLVGAQVVSRCRQRSCVLRAGLLSGAAASVSAVGVLTVSGFDGGVSGAAASVAGAFAGAAGGGLVALALSRPVESIFGYSSRLRLVELLSYDHPLLRRFMERAPGTFQHSVAVSLLARTAAEAINADALLVRVGALYHDVGKMENPQFFTENQRGENPHDGMPPSDSARVILTMSRLASGCWSGTAWDDGSRTSRANIKARARSRCFCGRPRPAELPSTPPPFSTPGRGPAPGRRQC